MFKLQSAVTEFPSENPPIFSEEFPKDREGAFDTSFDVVLFSCGGAGMAPSDNAGSRIPNGIELVSSVPNGFSLGYRTVTSRWREMMVAQFDILSKSNANANFLVNWFHRSMMNYAFIEKFFSAYGVTYFRFDGRSADAKSTEFGQDLYKRTLSYSVRLDLLVVGQVKTLETVSASVAPAFNKEAPDAVQFNSYDGP